MDLNSQKAIGIHMNWVDDLLSFSEAVGNDLTADRANGFPELNFKRREDFRVHKDCEIKGQQFIDVGFPDKC